VRPGKSPKLMRSPLDSKASRWTMSYSRAVPIYTSALTLLLLACSGGTETNDNCLVDLAPISARTNTVSVGDTMTFDANLGPAECLPGDVDSEDWRWSSSDTLIARIDSLSGFRRR
jgi:chitodextrinase